MELKDYSATVPSGVYEGKMWKRNDGLYANSDASHFVTPKQPTKWLLCWYGPSTNPDNCVIDYREILIV